VCNKNKPDELKDKIFLINADAEYAEGKNQNKLRQEDIEKIDYVFTNKLEISKYSKLVSNIEIAKKHDYNLNIRRYVDNTPEPEQEDVKAHLIGGIPEGEVQSKQTDFGKFSVDPTSLFQPERKGYLAFRPELTDKLTIKTALEADANLQKTINIMHNAIEQWWQKAQNEFTQLERNNNLPEIRSELLNSLKTSLVSIEVLDEFKTAGVFVNWWQNIRYDLKTIISSGWHHVLIPDEYLIDAFFNAEEKKIEDLEAKLNETQTELTEAVEAVEFEPDEDEKVTVSVIKNHLKTIIVDLKESKGNSATKERIIYTEQLDGLKKLESTISMLKKEIKAKQFELELKLSLKRAGTDEEKAAINQLIDQADEQIGNLDANNKDEKKKINALKKNKKILKERLDRADELMEAIGQQITGEECKKLILKKLYDLVGGELTRYLNAEKRALIGIIENLWDKYAVSIRELEQQQLSTYSELADSLKGLGYLR
jgi:type I restriction enzyme M protein